jgi:hypothetical protein
MSPEPQNSGLLKVRDKMLLALDKKYGKDLDWQAFRELDRLIMNGAASAAESAPPRRPHRESSESSSRPRPSTRWNNNGETLGDLGVAACNEAGRPVTTDGMVAYVGARRALNKDPKRARINVQSAMSHEDRLVSVKWRAGTAWWIKERELPKED